MVLVHMATFSVPQALQLAISHHQAGRLAEAIYRQLLAVVPTDPDVLRLLGILALQTGNHAVALGLCTRAIASDPARAESYNELGNVHFDQGQFDLAIAA
jgi:Flp pilus assembly protein TadD